MSRRALIVALLALLIIVIIVVLIAIPRARACEKQITGFWVGEAEFLKQAGLSSMELYLAPREGKCRQGYLVMINEDGSFVSNQGIEVCYGSKIGRWISAFKSHFGSSKPYTIPKAEVNFDNNEVIPSPLKIGLNSTEGTLSLFNDEKMYAFLTRDNETSPAANALHAEAS